VVRGCRAAAAESVDLFLQGKSIHFPLFGPVAKIVFFRIEFLFAGDESRRSLSDVVFLPRQPLFEACFFVGQAFVLLPEVGSERDQLAFLFGQDGVRVAIVLGKSTSKIIQRLE